MASIICEVCGYENPEGTTECEICANPLVKNTPSPTPVPAPAPQPTPVPEAVTPRSAPAAAQSVTQQRAPSANRDVEYFVMCPESQTKTIISDPNADSYFCQGCQTEHQIDGFIWSVESHRLNENTVATAEPAAAPKGDNLWLEEINSHYRIDITKPGGTFGRDAQFGSEFFTARGMGTISRVHCVFNYQFNNWTITHRSQINDTKYDGMRLSLNQPTLIEDGRQLTLSNAVTFVIRIG